MNTERAKRWVELEIESRGRGAQPTDDMFPSTASLASAEGLPRSVLEAVEFYCEGCFDWGSAWAHKYTIDDEALFLVYAGTDGDEGWIELFDEAGQSLATAYIPDRLIWEEQHLARARVERR